MRLIVSIDTEEDNWLPFSQAGYTTANTGRIPLLQKLFSDCGVRPTYLVTYQVASSNNAVTMLREIAAAGECEIGAHCHPWSQPPYEEQPVIENSMLCNLPSDLQDRKIKYLHRTIQDRFGITPTSFRSGRWGYSAVVASTLRSLKYEVDSSITAHTNWRYCHGPDYTNVAPSPYRFDPPNIYVRKSDGGLLEVPATVGYLQRDAARSHARFENLRHSMFARFHVLGVLDRLHLLNKVELTPERSSHEKMVALVARMRDQGHELATMWFHSSTLMPGLTPFVKSETDARIFLDEIRKFLVSMKDMGIESITLSEAQRLFPKN